MKRLILPVLMLALASCTKEKLEEQTNEPIYVDSENKAVFEGDWIQDDSISVTITKTQFITDTLVWNMRFDLDTRRYILDTNGVDTYSQMFERLMYTDMRWNQINLINNELRIINFVKQ